MWKFCIMLICLIGYTAAGPLASRHHVRFKSRHDRSNEQMSDAAEVKPNSESIAEQTTTSVQDAPARHTSKLNLPSNATSIRADIKDTFSCENRIYGYYADIDNDCQIFHVCMPVTYADGKEHYFRWSFICPEETIFSQDSFTCMHRQNMLIECSESMQYYELNRNLGLYTPNEEANRQTVRNHNNNSNNKNRRQDGDEDQDAAMSSHQEEILTEDNEHEEVAPKATEPTIIPAKTYKPNRRKPIASMVRPTEVAAVTVKTEPVVVKKTVQKVFKRPTSATSTLKKNKPKINAPTPNPVVQQVEEQIIQHRDGVQQANLHEKEVPVVTRTTEMPIEPQVAAVDVQPSQSEQVTKDEEVVEQNSENEPAKEFNLNVETSDNVNAIETSTMTDEEKNFLKQTAGGFETVDPTMAAEAEALINDFLQTMLKSETQQGEAIASTELPLAELPIEAEKVDSPIKEIPEALLPVQMNPFPIEEQAAVETDKPINLMQIPVTVVQTPAEEVPEKEVESIDKLDSAGPISIDDVIASVKERLDQTDAPDTDTVVQEAANGEKEDVEQLTDATTESIIVPIYHRLGDSSSSAQLVDSVQQQPDETILAQITQTDVGPETESQSTTS